jgi:hypothetical protein
MGSSSNISSSSSSSSSRHAHHTSPTATMMMSLRRRRRRQRRILSMIMSLLLFLFSIVVSFQYTATNIVIVEAVVVEAAGAADASIGNENENEIESESLSSGSCATSSNVDNDNNETVCITGSNQLNSNEIYKEENENENEDDDEMKENRQCIVDAKNGLCDKYPKDMFQRCPYSCINYNEKLGSIIYLRNKNDDSDDDNELYNDDDDNDNDVCGNLIEDEICEEYAHYTELNCLRNQSYMLKHCPKSCLKCFDFTINNSSIEINIGVTQIIDDSIMMKTNDDYKPTTSKDGGIITKFLSTIEKTNDYMLQQVMKDDKYISVRKYCHNYNKFCTFGVTTRTQKVFCNQDNSNGINNKLVCGPACHSCDEMLLSQQEIDLLYDCTPDTSTDIFINDNDNDDEEEEDEEEDEDEVNAEDEDSNSNEQKEQQKKITLDTMFQRIIGEVPYPKEYANKVPSFDATVLSRPTLNPIIHQNMSINDLQNDIDFVLGGPWIIQLDNFLTDEECTRLIELGDIIGRDISTIEVDDDESSSEESTNDKDENNNDGDNDNDIESEDDEEEEEEEEEQWRTSTTAWCDEDDCKDDPITKHVQEKIGVTTSVLDPAYFEHLQLLKYIPGQFYKNHHDESGSQHDIDYNISGPRIITFFLYLNDLDDDDDDNVGADSDAGAGGETRFTNIFGDETNIYLDVKPKKGRALIWPSMLNEDLYEFEPKTYHEARIVNKGNKYGANAWLHLRDVRNVHCDEDQLEPIRSKLDQIQQQ